MEFVNALGLLMLLAGCVFAGAYGLRHRGTICKWLENLDHKENTTEKKGYIKKLKRQIEDDEAELATLEKETSAED